MKLRHLPLLLFLGYVALDLSTPMLPGAFVFNADHSVEGVSADAGRSQELAAPPVCLEPSVAPFRSVPSPDPCVRANPVMVVTPRVPFERSQLVAADAGDLSEDH